MIPVLFTFTHIQPRWPVYARLVEAHIHTEDQEGGMARLQIRFYFFFFIK